MARDLGIVTAYAYAVSKGYTGTEEEFAELMASYATVAEEAEASADRAEEQAGVATQQANASASSARDALAARNETRTARDTAVASATAASQSANAASTKAGEANTSANAAAASATAAAGSATNAATSASTASSQANAASGSATNAASSATAAATAKTGAEAAQAAAEAVLESIPDDYTELSDEVDELKSAFESVTTIQNLFDSSTIKQGGYWKSDGSIYVNANSYYSEQYIPVEAGVSYTFTNDSNNGYIATYDSSKNFIARVDPSGTTYTPASGVAFVRWSIYNMPFPDGFKFAKTADFGDVISDHIGLDGTKIVDAPFSPLLTDDFFSVTVDKTVLTYGGNYYPSANGTKTELSTQYWYEIVAENDFSLWCDPGVTYPDIMIAVYNDGTAGSSTFVARYRKNESTNTLPTESNKLSILKGQLIAFSVFNDIGFSFLSDGMKTADVFKSGILLSDEQLAQAGNAIKTIKVQVQTGRYDILFGGYDVRILQTVNADTRSNLWNIRGVYKNGRTIVPPGTDIVGVCRENGESDYMGGVHGDETNVTFYITADGVPITEDVECNKIDILMYSHLTRVSTGANIIDRYVHIVITNGCIEVETTFKGLVDGLSMYEVLAGGMFAWYEADKLYAMTNVGAISGSGATGTTILENDNMYSTTVIFDNAVASAENIIGRGTEGYYGQAYYYGNESNPRMKIYYTTAGNVTMNNGDIYYGKSRYTFS